MMKSNHIPAIGKARRTGGTRFGVSRVVEKIRLTLGNVNHLIVTKNDLFETAFRMLNDIDRHTI